MGEAQGQITTMIIIDLLMKNMRLPCPRDCPHEVTLDIMKNQSLLNQHCLQSLKFDPDFPVNRYGC